VFRPFDDSLVSMWSKTKTESSPAYTTALQKQLQEVLPPYLNDPQAQLAEIQPNQQWLKNTTWQLSTASPGDNDSGLPPYPSPVDIGRDLLPMVSHLPGNLGLPGLRLVEKLLTVTFSLSEALAMQPTTRTPFTMGPREHLHEILNVATVLRYGDHRFLPLLLSKVQDALPKLASPMLRNAPETAAPPCDIDIFDGFGTAGIGQPSCFSVSEDYDNKFAVSRMDDISPESGSPGGGPSSHSSHDVNSPFASSPPIMSPGMELQQSLPTDFADMVMSPMNHAPPNSLGTPGGLATPQPHNPQQTPISPYPNINPQMQGLGMNGLNPPPNITLASQVHHNPGLGTGIGNNLGQPVVSSNLIARPQPQRANSFAIGGPQIRTVGDFQALQRVNSDMTTMSSLGMSAMGRELDFNTLPR